MNIIGLKNLCKIVSYYRRFLYPLLSNISSKLLYVFEAVSLFHISSFSKFSQMLYTTHLFHHNYCHQHRVENK
jgi:hypothetical protein